MRLMKNNRLWSALVFMLLTMGYANADQQDLAGRSVKELVEMADSGITQKGDVQLYLCKHYFFGSAVPKNYRKAVDYCLEAERYGDQEAKSFLEMVLAYENDDAERFMDKFYYQEMKWNAEQGNNPYAQHALAVAYNTGQGFPVDYKQARFFYEMALTNPSAEDEIRKTSSWNLGLLYLNGQGGKVDEEKARKSFELSFELGNDKAIEKLASMYHQGVGGAIDHAKALKFFLKILEHNEKNVNILFTVANYYYEGLGTAQDFQKARQYFQMAADLGSTQAERILAIMASKGEGVRASQKEARLLLESAANKNDVQAIMELAQLYQRGDSVPVDLKKALQHYRHAAELGSSDASYQVGLMLYNGQGTNKDLKRARDAFKAAADKGMLEAAYNLGVMYANGEGGSVDLKKAEQFYETAAAAGLAEAEKALVRLRKQPD